MSCESKNPKNEYICLFVPLHSSTVVSSFSHTVSSMCQYQIYAVSMSNFWHIELSRCVQTLSCPMMSSFFNKMLSLGVKRPEREADH